MNERLDYRAFVSSTYEDLKDHREHVIQALRDAGISVDPMEDWPASTEEPRAVSQERVHGCDLCVLLLGLRRGHVPAGETRSITQLEYEEARRKGIDVLVFLLREEAPWPEEFNELGKDPDLVAWRKSLMSHKTVDFFDSNPSSIRIAPALTRWVQTKPRTSSRIRILRRIKWSSSGAVILAAYGALTLSLGPDPAQWRAGSIFGFVSGLVAGMTMVNPRAIVTPSILVVTVVFLLFLIVLREPTPSYALFWSAVLGLPIASMISQLVNFLVDGQVERMAPDGDASDP